MYVTVAPMDAPGTGSVENAAFTFTLVELIIDVTNRISPSCVTACPTANPCGALNTNVVPVEPGLAVPPEKESGALPKHA
jgi:hypothetical protein